MKKMLLLCLLLVSYGIVFSQSTDSVSSYQTWKPAFGFALCVPVGILKGPVDYCGGFEPSIIYSPPSGEVEFFGQAGLYIFKKAGDRYGINLFHIPVVAGARFNFNDFLIGAGAGYGFFWNEPGHNSGLLLSPQAGYDFDRMQALVQYTAAFVKGGTMGYAGIKLVVVF